MTRDEAEPGAVQTVETYRGAVAPEDCDHLGHMNRKSVEFRHDLVKVAGGETVMSTRFKCVLLDLDRRAAAELPADIRDRMTALIARPG